MSPRRRFPWDRLGIDATDDAAAIRKAYADALRAMNVDEDVAGYAELRRARDEALWLAANSGDQPSDDDHLGLGHLEDDTEGSVDADWFEDDGAADWEAYTFGESRPPYGPHGAAAQSGKEETQAQAQAHAAWDALLAILYPDGEHSEEAMSLAQMDEGRAALAILIARAEVADLAEHDALDNALAELLARAWPRSGPLVERAAEAFDWLAEAGSLEERPVLRFLNERLKGMRFHAKVQEPDHPLHKAWVQLSQPGRAGVADRLRIKRADVDKLLTGIRRNFPEIESHLDPQRVASWDAGRPAEGAPGLVPRIIRGLFIVLLVVVVPRLIPQWTDPNAESLLPPAAKVERRFSDAEVDAQVSEIFGAGVTMADVTRVDPKLAPELLAAVNTPEDILPLNFVRMKAAGSAEVAPRGALEVRAQLKALWLTAALAQGGKACGDITSGALAMLSLKLSAAERAREQELLRQLLEAKVLSHMPEGGEVRYSVPDWLVEDTLGRSGLTPEALKAALGDPDSPDRCKAELGLVEAVAAASDKVPDEVLKGL